MYFQQGDVLLTLVENVSGSMVPTDLVHKGMNHHHKIKGNAEVFVNDTEMFILVKDEATLYHEEHKEIRLPMGAYKKSIVKEYDHWEEESKEVID
jgi:hypothetical protein